MYRGGYQDDVPVITSYDDYDGEKAKQRASVRWLVAKAYNNQVPANLREPYYRDQGDGCERLKPQIVHALASAELYCSCLANIYADPNYHNLSHWGVIQALARKGVYVAEPSDVALTETVLIQTGPIKMSAHLAVMEAIQSLYIRELITAERVVGVVRRFTALQGSTELPADQEEALLLWINKACARLRGQIAAEEDTVPRFPLQQDISDLSDGTCLAGLISLYCPDELSWPEIAFSDPPRIADSLYNLQLVEKFCHEALPYNPHFLTLEDILYMHSSVKRNLLVLLADLFYLFEINPAKCVRQPGSAKERQMDNARRLEPYGDSPRRSQPELRRDSLSQGGSVSAAGRESPSGRSSGGARRPVSMYPTQADGRGVDDSRSNSEESEFVVQRASGPMTLSRLAHQRRSQSPPSSVHSDEPPSRRPQLKERLNRDTKWQERGEERRGAASSECGDTPERAAGKPSPRAGGGRLSRRGSFSEESQLTVENFGGSQENLQLLGRNPDKQPVVHRGRRESSAHRDLLKESNISFGDRDPFQEAERDRAERDRAQRAASRASAPLERADSRAAEPTRPPSRNLFQGDLIREHFDASEQRRGGGGGVDEDDRFRPIDDTGGSVDIDNRVLDALEREARGDSPAKAGNNLVIMFDNNDEQKPTSFAELSKVQPRDNAGGINIVYMQHEKEDRGKPRVPQPSGAGRSNGAAATTSWVRQQQQQREDGSGSERGGARQGLNASEGIPEPDMMASELQMIKLRLEEKRRNIEKEKRRMETAMNRQKQNVGKQAFLQAMGQEVNQNLHHLKDKWSRVPDTPGSPQDLDTLDYDQYTSSLHNMNESLSELQDDIQRLSQQQSQMQQMHNIMQNGGQTQPPYQQAYQSPQYQTSPYASGGPPQVPPGQFYLHDQSGQRRQWAPPVPPPEHLYQQQMSPGRARWGQPVRPMMGGMPQQYGPGPTDPYGYHQPPQQQGPPGPPRPFMLHDQQGHPAAHGGYPGPGGYHQSPQHHRMDGGMMGAHGMAGPQPGYGHHPDYSGYPPPQSDSHYPPHSAASGAGGGGFRLHGGGGGRDVGRDVRDVGGGGAQEPRELRAGQSPRMYGDYQYGRSGGGGSVGGGSRDGDRSRRRSQSPSVLHAPLPAPPLDDMAPQSVSFIGDQEREEEEEPIPTRPPRRADRNDRQSSPASGGRTYRVPRSDPAPIPAAAPSPAGRGTFKVRRSPSPQRERSPAASASASALSGSPSWAARRAESESPMARVAAARQESRERERQQEERDRQQQEEEPAPEVLAAMKVDKIKQDADPDMGFVISFDDDAAPRKPKPRLGQRRPPGKAASSGSLLDQPERPIIPPKPKLSAISTSSAAAGAGGVGAPSAFSTYTKWPKTSRGAERERERESPIRASPPPSPPSSGGLSLGRLSDPRRSTAPVETVDEVDRAVPLLEKLEIDPTLPPETMKPLKPAQPSAGVGLVIGDELVSPKSDTLDEMERKKERILMMSLKRKQDQEAARIRKEEEAQRKKEDEARKEEEKARKKEEEKARKERIFEQYKLKKAIEEAEKNGTPIPAGAQAALAAQQAASKPAVRPRPKSTPSKPRPKSMMDGGAGAAPGTPSRGGHRGSQSNLQQMSDKAGDGGDSQWGSSSSLTAGPRSRRGSNASLYGENRYARATPVHSGRKMAPPNEPSATGGGGGGTLRKDGGHRASSGSLSRPRSRMGPRTGSSGSLTYDEDAGYRRTAFAHSGRRQSGTSGGTPRYSETDSGLGRDTPTRRGASPAAYGGVTSPSGPGSLPPGLVSRRRNYGDDGASDTSSMASYDYNGPRLFKQASSKSNRSIMLNAVEYCVFPGAVNREAKQRVLEEIARVEARHFLILFRDARCQFRALYCYEPETEEVFKLYGTGPKMANDKMFDKFFKYNSGGKSFTQIHTKHLSVTIDAFTIHDALWQGKRPSLPSKKDMTLVT